VQPPVLFSKPIKQESWYLQIKEKIGKSKRPIDNMSVAQVRQIYIDRQFLCDLCGKILQNPSNISLEEHILHLINPSVEWSCEDCFQSDLRNGRILAMSEDPKAEQWQQQNE
jgi:hypothetical protein